MTIKEFIIIGIQTALLMIGSGVVIWIALLAATP
jgi:hypothetical protein